MNHPDIAGDLVTALGRAADPPSLLPLVEGIHEALAHAGIQADRIQIPMSRDTGFRHPTLGLLLLTWSTEHGTDQSETRTHEELDALPLPGVATSPFEGVVLRGDPPCGWTWNGETAATRCSPACGPRATGTPARSASPCPGGSGRHSA